MSRPKPLSAMSPYSSASNMAFASRLLADWWVTARSLVYATYLFRSTSEGSGNKQIEEYYKYFLDVGPEDIRTSFPGLTKLTLVAPYEPGHIDSVYPEMVSIRNMIAATHPRIGRRQDDIRVSERQLRRQRVTEYVIAVYDVHRRARK